MSTVRIAPWGLTLLLVAACATGGGAKHFRAGEKARDAGDLEASELAYTKALEAEPDNAQYKAALTGTRRQLAERSAEDARAKEKAGDWQGASAAWERAAQAAPEETEFKARKELSAAKAQNLGPDEWFERLRQIDQTIPKNQIIERALAGARAKACAYHVGLGDQFLSSRQGVPAQTHYDRAKEIDPTAPGLDGGRYDEALALALMEQADDKERAGDAVLAHELYQKAFEKKPLPEIRAKMQKVKTKASAVLGKLEAARALAEKGKTLEALRAYESLAGAKGVPASVEGEVQELRRQLLKQEADRARSAAEGGDAIKGQKGLLEALRWSDLDKPEQETVKSALSEMLDGRPGKGLRTLEGVGLGAQDPLQLAARAVGLAVAKRAYEKARGMAKKDPAGALAAISDLGPCEDSIPGIKDLRRELRSGSFQEMLDDALKAARAGDDGEAATLLMAALSASNAPAGLKDPVSAGAEALRQGRYVDADLAFQKAVSAESRSKLAQRGVDIARLRRKEAEKAALETLKSGKGDTKRAAELLAQSLAIEPGNVSARGGAEALLARAEAGAKSAADGDLAEWLGLALRLSGAAKNAQEAAARGVARLEKGEHAAAETDFGQALEAAPDWKLAKLGRGVAKERGLIALKSGVKRAAEGDEGSARALAEVLKKDPSDPDARVALAAILDKARVYAKDRADGDAARQLGLAVVATGPAPGVKAAQDKGVQAMAQGKMEEAEKAFAEALELEPENQVAKTGFDIAKEARLAKLSAAMDEAKKGTNVEQAREALKKTLELDPGSPEARKAFGELLDEAQRQAEQGNDAQAASLLEAANVVSKPETARNAIGVANKLLGEGRHGEAEQAYEKVRAGGESKVAERGQQIARARRVAVLVLSAKELMTAQDLERGAKAVAELLKLDPQSADAKGALDGALAEAERRAGSGDEKGAAAVLRACAQATGEVKELNGAILRFESGKYDDAEAEFGKVGSELARRAGEIVRQRKLGTLKAGLTGDDRAAAESIKKLLAQDPNNKEALAAFNKLLDKARAESGKGNEKGAAEALLAASLASNAKEDLARSLEVAATHLQELRYAQAERGFLDALELVKDSKVAKLGQELAKKGRLKAEKDAEGSLKKPGDPRPAAKVLAGSLLVEPQSKLVSGALDLLLSRAKKAAEKGDDGDLAQSLEGAAPLEGASSDIVEGVGKGAALLSKGSFEEAEAAFTAALAAGEDGAPKKSRVASAGRELSRTRRVQVLKAELEAAKKEGDVLRQSDLVQKILGVDGSDKGALELSKKLKGSVADSRLASAQREKEAGRRGVALVYLRRVLAMEPGHAKAKAEVEALEGELKKQLDLVMVADKIARAPSVAGSACASIEEPLRELIMADGSKRTDLGGYLLSPDWTRAVEAKDKSAPAVGGRLAITLSRCQCGSSTGNLTLLWQLEVPPGAEPAVKGAMDAELPAGVVPRDEQDGEGKNARKALSKRAAKVLLDKLADERSAVAGWLLALAEHGVKQKDVGLVADAHARLLLKRPPGLDPVRLAAIEQYLDGELK